LRDGCFGDGGGLDLKTARGVVEVEQDAAAFFGDHADGLVEHFAAVAVGIEDVAGGAAGVYADEDGVGATPQRRGPVVGGPIFGNPDA